MVAKTVGAGSAPSRGRKEGSGSKSPSDKQEQILRAYAWAGNAAAVGRELGTNEGHVRRLARQFPERLEELRRERDQERREKADAREARLQVIVDPVLDAALTRLQAIVTSADDRVAVPAIKLAIDLALRVPAPAYAPTELDRALAEDERRTARMIAVIDDGSEEDDRDE
jgi:nitrogen fixation/metabolism regulation signal transduction histidine kinase